VDVHTEKLRQVWDCSKFDCSKFDCSSWCFFYVWSLLEYSGLPDFWRYLDVRKMGGDNSKVWNVLLLQVPDRTSKKKKKLEKKSFYRKIPVFSGFFFSFLGFFLGPFVLFSRPILYYSWKTNPVFLNPNYTETKTVSLIFIPVFIFAKLNDLNLKIWNSQICSRSIIVLYAVV